MSKQVKSECCNNDIVPAKGSYMGESYVVCWQCNRKQSSRKEQEWEKWLNERNKTKES